MNESKHKKYENFRESQEQRMAPVIFSKNDKGLPTINVDLRKISNVSGICLFIIISMDLLYIIIGYFKPEENLFTEVSCVTLIIVNVILIISALLFRIQSRGAIHYYTINKNFGTLVRKTKLLGKSITKVYNLSEITHVSCKRISAEGGSLYNIYIMLTKKRKIKFFYGSSKQNALKLAKDLSNHLETNCIFPQSQGSQEQWNEPSFYNE